MHFIPSRRHAWGMLLAWLLAAPLANCQFNACQLHALSRSSATPGESFQLSTAGSLLEEVDMMWFSHPGITASVKSLPVLPFSDQPRLDYGTFQVSVADDVPPGRYESRVTGRHGTSNPRAFLVSPFPAKPLPEAKPPRDGGAAPDRGATPPELAPDTLWFGACTAGEKNRFTVNRFQQSVRIDLLAQALDSQMIGQLRLFDQAGRSVADSRGGDGIDPSLDLDDLPPGKYILEISDFLYRGGGSFGYHVAIQDSETAIDLLGKIREESLPRYTSIGSSTVGDIEFARPGVSPPPRLLEIPGSIADWFSEHQTDNIFEFEAEKGDRIAIDLISQRCNQPTDGRMMIDQLESNGDVKRNVAHVDDSQNIGDDAVHLRSQDPTTLFVAPETSRYRLTLRDLDLGTSLLPRQRFLLQLRQPAPGFDLLAYRPTANPDAKNSQIVGCKLFRGGTESIRVFVIRRDGWAGPIKVRIDGLPKGVTCQEAIVAPNQTQVQLTLVARSDADSFSGPIQVIGISEDDSIRVTAVPATIAWPASNSRYVRSRLCENLWLNVSSQDETPLRVEFPEEAIELKQGQKVKLPIKLMRAEGGKSNCIIRPRDLPRGVSIPNQTIPGNKSDGSLEFQAKGDAALGTYSVWLQIETKIKLKLNPEFLNRAQAYRDSLQALHDDPKQDANKKAIQSAIAEADKTITIAKTQAVDKEQTVFIPTPHFTLRVIKP